MYCFLMVQLHAEIQIVFHLRKIYTSAKYECEVHVYAAF